MTTDAVLQVAAGLAGGAQVRGRLPLRGAGRVVDLLNNWNEPTLQLGAASAGTVVVVRPELVWLCALEPEPVAWAPSPGGRFGTSQPLLQARPVVVHAGPFELTGTLHTYPAVSWPDFLLAQTAPGSFFALANARIVGPSGTLEAPAVAINATRVSALLSLN
jgi:hypothetical protein